MKEYKFIWLYFDGTYRDHDAKGDERKPLANLTDAGWEIMNILSWSVDSQAGSRVQTSGGQALLQHEKKSDPGQPHSWS